MHDSERHISQLRTRVAQRDYQVDPREVAAVLLRQPLLRTILATGQQTRS